MKAFHLLTVVFAVEKIDLMTDTTSAVSTMWDDDAAVRDVVQAAVGAACALTSQATGREMRVTSVVLNPLQLLKREGEETF